MRGMGHLFLSAVFVMAMGVCIGQAQADQSAPTAKTVAAEEGKTPETLLAAVYAVISGPAGERDWEHFRALFLPDARLTATREKPDGVSVASMSVDDYAKAAGAYFKKEGFYEQGVVNKIFRFGRMADVLTSYESRHAPGEKPFARGINSMQMINDGHRWWLVSIAWDEEGSANSMPKEFEAK